MAIKREEKFEGIKKVVISSFEKGSTKAINEKTVTDLGLPAEVFSFYSGLVSGIWVSFQPYHKARRSEMALDADLLTDEERNVLKKPVWDFWSELVHGVGLKCTPDDFEVLWDAYEKLAKNNKNVFAAGGTTPKRFQKCIDVELGLRLKKAAAMTPEQIEYMTEKKRLTRQVKNLEEKLKADGDKVNEWAEVAKMFKDDSPEKKAVIEELLEQAKSELAETESKLKSAKERKAGCTLKSVTERIKLEAEGKEKEEEEEKKPKATAKKTTAKKAESEKAEPKKATTKKATAKKAEPKKATAKKTTAKKATAKKATAKK